MPTHDFYILLVPQVPLGLVKRNFVYSLNKPLAVNFVATK